MGKAKLLTKTDRLIQGHGFVQFRLIQGRLMEYQFSSIMVLSKCSLSNSNDYKHLGWTERQNSNVEFFPIRCQPLNLSLVFHLSCLFVPFYLFL